MEATVVLCKCAKQNTFGIRMEKRGDDWHRTWAFKIDENRAKKEGFDKTVIKGGMIIDDKYPGCPYCKAYAFFQCECGRLNCFKEDTKEVKDGEMWDVTCNWCGKKVKVMTSSTFEIKSDAR